MGLCSRPVFVLPIAPSSRPGRLAPEFQALEEPPGAALSSPSRAAFLGSVVEWKVHKHWNQSHLSRYWLPSPFGVWLWGSLDLLISEMGADTSGRCMCTSANPVVIQERWDLVLSHCAPVSRPGCTPVLPDPREAAKCAWGRARSEGHTFEGLTDPSSPPTEQSEGGTGRVCVRTL